MAVGWKIAAGVGMLILVLAGTYEWMVGAAILGLMYDIVRMIFPVFPQR